VSIDLIPYVIDGRYQLERVISRGGIGVIFAAHDREQNREVAIKVFRASALADPRAQDRFQREVQVAAQINSPLLAATFGDGVLPDASAYVVTELVRGRSLREEMRRELKSLQQRVHITVIFVTHDQIEALSLSDRIAIMKFGVLEQVGTPEDVYFRPATPFVRDFLGKTFLLQGKVRASSEQSIDVEVEDVTSALLTLPRKNVVSSANGSLSAGQGVMVAIRPEQVNLTGSRQERRANMVEATLQAVLFLGDRYEYTVMLGSETRVLVSPVPQGMKAGEKVFLELKPEGMTLWPSEK